MQHGQYDVVEVKAIRREVPFEPDDTNRRPPRVGDIATIVEVYANPPGYELECSDHEGITQWLLAFRPEDIELESVK